MAGQCGNPFRVGAGGEVTFDALGQSAGELWSGTLTNVRFVDAPNWVLWMAHSTAVPNSPAMMSAGVGMFTFRFRFFFLLPQQGTVASV